MTQREEPRVNNPDRAQTPGMRIAFVQSTWHESIVDRCRDSFIEEIARLGVAEDRISALSGALIGARPWEKARKRRS